MRGDPADFQRERIDGRYMADVAGDCTMHPVLPLTVECAWADADGEGLGLAGADATIVTSSTWWCAAGTIFSAPASVPNPHGGVGFLEYRNLMSNYGRYAGRPELGRAARSRGTSTRSAARITATGAKPFMAVDYMDLHILKPDCGIGLHRHRDNQEVFLMLEGRAYMVVGDWCQMPDRERCFEIRTLQGRALRDAQGRQPPRPDERDRRGHPPVHVRRVRLGHGPLGRGRRRAAAARPAMDRGRSDFQFRPVLASRHGRDAAAVRPCEPCGSVESDCVGIRPTQDRACLARACRARRRRLSRLLWVQRRRPLRAGARRPLRRAEGAARPLRPRRRLSARILAPRIDRSRVERRARTAWRDRHRSVGIRLGGRSSARGTGTTPSSTRCTCEASPTVRTRG